MSAEITYQTIKTQNTTLYNSILNMYEMYSTDASRILYKTENYHYVYYITGAVFYIYYAVFLLFMIVLYFNRKSVWWLKIILVILFLVYPFGIYFVENWLYQTIRTSI